MSFKTSKNVDDKLFFTMLKIKVKLFFLFTIYEEFVEEKDVKEGINAEKGRNHADERSIRSRRLLLSISCYCGSNYTDAACFAWPHTSAHSYIRFILSFFLRFSSSRLLAKPTILPHASYVNVKIQNKFILFTPQLH